MALPCPTLLSLPLEVLSSCIMCLLSPKHLQSCVLPGCMSVALKESHAHPLCASLSCDYWAPVMHSQSPVLLCFILAVNPSQFILLLSVCRVYKFGYLKNVPFSTCLILYISKIFFPPVKYEQGCWAYRMLLSCQAILLKL